MLNVLNIKIGHILFFHLQKPPFPVDAARIARQAPIGADDSVAWYDQGYRIVSDRTADGLCGHMPEPHLFSHFSAISP